MADSTDTGAATTTTDAGNGGGQNTDTTGKSFSQMELDRIVGERLAREREKYAGFEDIKAKAEEYDKLAEARKTAEQKLTEKLTGAETRASTAEGKLLRYEIAASKGLDAKWAMRLSGSTKEELEADADALAKEIGGTSQRTTFDGGVRTPAPASGGMDAVIRARASR